jgi:hypothetical protein
MKDLKVLQRRVVRTVHVRSRVESEAVRATVGLLP